MNGRTGERRGTLEQMQAGIDSGAVAPSAGTPAPIRRGLQLIVLMCPALTVAVRGGANGSLMAAALLSLVTLAVFASAGGAEPAGPGGRMLRAYALAMTAPLVVLAVVQALHGEAVVGSMGSAARLLLAVPVVLLLNRFGRSLVPWADASFALGAFAAGAAMLFLSREWQPGRWGSWFLDPINFGGLALLLGVLSLLSLDWYRRDSTVVRLLKIAGFGAGVAASVPTGARGAWLALLVVIVLLAATMMRGRSPALRAGLAGAALAVLLVVFATVEPVRDRFNLMFADLGSFFGEGDRDTSPGIRLQIWRAGLIAFAERPLLGLGGDGFSNAVSTYVSQGLLTPRAADFARAEMHNTYLAYAVDYGLPGLLVLVGAFAVPAWVFARRLPADPVRRRAALLGLVVIAMYASFAMSVDVFGLKMMVAFYATTTAILAAIALAADDGQAADVAGPPAGSR